MLNSNKNSRFETHDILLATFLKTKGIELREIQPIKPYHCIFIFETVPEHLLNEWLTTEAKAPVRTTIGEYRHLARSAKIHTDMLLKAGVHHG